MATSPYFNNTRRRSEQDLHESLVIENIKIFGTDILYVPIETFEVDPVLGEPKNVTFQNTYTIEAYLPDNGESDGQQNIMSKFGFRVNKTIEILISRKRFHELGTGKLRPHEGDLIYLGNPDDPSGSYHNVFYEINQVSFQSPEWPFGNHYTYKLFCETYTYNFDKFETGVPAIDQFDLTGDDDTNDRLSNIEQNADNNKYKAKKNELVRFDKNNPLTGI